MIVLESVGVTYCRHRVSAQLRQVNKMIIIVIIIIINQRISHKYYGCKRFSKKLDLSLSPLCIEGLLFVGTLSSLDS